MKFLTPLLKIAFMFLLGICPLISAYCQEVKIVVTSNTADLKDPATLFTVMDAHSKTTHDPIIWMLNGDVFGESLTEEQVDGWLQSASRFLDAHSNVSILLNQGEREWSSSGKSGWKNVQHLEEMVKLIKHPRLRAFLDNGCPGPFTFSVSPQIDVIAFNSQWWNHPYEKPLPYMNFCSITDEDVFLEKITDLLDDSKDKKVLMVSHFPLMSLGKYGGRFPLSSYLLPPLIGSAVVSFRQNVGTTNDIVNQNFNRFRTKLLNVLEEYSNVVIVSGHDKNHSILTDEGNVHVNSGALENGDFVAASKDALMVSSKPGFVELGYDSAAVVHYRFYEWNGKVLTAGPENVLLKPLQSESTVIRGEQNSEAAYRGKTTRVAAGPEYRSSAWGRFWFGKHYRKSWVTEVDVPYLDLDTTFRGLTVTRKGGGRQTTSVKLMGGNGKEYVFRSVNKDPSKALQRSMRGTLVSQIIKDQTSTQQPYGALTASYLLDQIEILHARPRLYVLPPDDRLGAFKSQYGNLLGMLEDSPSDKIEKGKVFGGADNIERSHKLFQKLYEDHDNTVDRQEFCRARVFDLWVGDWGKHEDNWKWAGYKKYGGNFYRPIPRDRDHVFSRWDGAIPYLADREWAKETGEDFSYKIKGLRSLMQQARHMDRLLGSQLTKADWINTAKQIQDAISLAEIEQAVKQMPAEIYSVDGKEIEAKLKARLKDLPYYAEKYYSMLAHEVDVVGSNKAEYFLVTRNTDGSVQVTVYDISKKGLPDFQSAFYDRKFLPEETKEIRLYGLTNSDIFVIRGNADKSILVRIIPGDFRDDVSDSSFVKGASKKTLIYQEGNNTSIHAGKEAKSIFPKNRALYHYQRTAFAYNTYFPFVLISYNPFTGVTLNTRVTFTNHNFSKPDFSTRHTLSGSVSLNENYEVSYKNQFRYLIGKWDGVSEINLSRPLNYNYFFGIGNNTTEDKNFGKNYYRAQYNSLLVNAGLTRMFWKQSQLTLLAGFESDEGIARPSSFLSDNPDELSIQQLQMWSVKGMLNLDFRDDRFLPLRGFRLNLEQELVHLDNGDGNMATKSLLELEQYVSTRSRDPLTLGFRAGGGITTGTLPFYKLFSLGQLNDLHGFKRNRFTGESKAYLNTELRWQVLETQNRFIPVKAGLRAFFDVGRVWADHDPDEANYWHKGYGGGFYVTPFTNQFSVNVSFGASKAEPFLFMFGIGGFLK